MFALLAVVASASDLGQYQEQQQEDDEHTPYQFSYAVDDDDTVFSRSEQGDEEGDVTGEYCCCCCPLPGRLTPAVAQGLLVSNVAAGQGRHGPAVPQLRWCRVDRPKEAESGARQTGAL